jgi:glycine/D-amino acid oxidase-like deaminating enzyme
MVPANRSAVIGAGVVGASIAFRLAEKGREVVLLDGAAPGSGATGMSFAAVHAHAQVPHAYFALCQAAMEAYRHLVWQLAPAPWYHAEGSLVWFHDPDRSAALREDVQRLRDWGYAADLIPAGKVLAELEPGLAIDDAETPVAWFPGEAWVDATALTRRVVESVRHAGGRVLTGPERAVVAIEREGRQVAAVMLAGGQTIPVAAVINAAGVHAGDVAALVGRHLPVLAPRSLVIWAELPHGADPLHRPVATDDIALRPDGAGRVLLVPGTDVNDIAPGPIPANDPLTVEAMARAAAAVPALEAARPTQAFVATWPILDDGLPCVGAISSIPGYFEAVTDYGVTLVPLIGRSLAEEVLGRPGDPLLDPFRADRFAASHSP